MSTKEKDPLEGIDGLPEGVREAADKAKKEGLRPYWVTLNGISFVYRPIKRKEWRELTRKQNKELIDVGEDQLALAEIKSKYVEEIVGMCVLWSEIPVDDNLGAGYVETLSDAILIDSGFGTPDVPSIEV